MNIHEGNVNRYAGDGVFERECKGGCGRTVTWRMTSRTDSARQPRFCEECAERNAKEAEDERLRQQAAYDREHADTLQLLREAGTPVVRYAEFSGVPGTWAVDEDGNPLALQ